ncbi:mannosyltransferase [Pseudomonas fulva]|nr:DUF6543 domain-containing protein [Pseudomonas fulva]MBF8779225.1 mannosyltransferase [Pseudomonas fulva]
MTSIPYVDLRLARAALVDFPRPDEMAEALLADWLASHGVRESPRQIDVVTVHYQHEPLGEGRAHYRENAIVTQKMDLVAALLGNWQGEPASGYGGFHYGRWAGHAPTGPLRLVERLAANSLFDNSDPYQVFNGLYRRTTPALYSPQTCLPIRAEDFQGFIWSLRFHHRFKESLDHYWARQAQRYQRAMKIAFIAACNKQVCEGSLGENGRQLAWQAAGLVRRDAHLRLSMLNVYGYSSTSILRITNQATGVTLLYIPGNSSPFQLFTGVSQLQQWFARQCREFPVRAALLQHFSPADWPDGLDYSGLRTALAGLGLFPAAHHFAPEHPGFATSGIWDPQQIVEYRHDRYSPAIEGDLFAHLAQLQRRRSYAEADSQIVSNHQIEKARWGSYLKVGLNLLMPLALVVPQLAPLLAVGGLAELGLGIERVVDGSTLADKSEGVQQQAFGLLNALPLAVGAFAQPALLFAYRRPGFFTWASLRDLATRASKTSDSFESLEMLPAQAAFRPPTPYAEATDGILATRVEHDLLPRFHARLLIDGQLVEESVEYELASDTFIRSGEVEVPDAPRWIAHGERAEALVRLEAGPREVNDAQRMATLRKLGMQLDLPITRAPFEALQTLPIPRRVASLWVGDRIIDQAFLDTLASNARALHGSGYRFELFLSRRSPEAFERNDALLAERAPGLQVLALEDQEFYRDFTASPCFAQYQAALNVSGTGASNFSSACDILRIQLLRQLGGLYLDADDQVLVSATAAGPRARLADLPLRTSLDGLILAPPVSNDQLGLYFKYNSSMIGSHPGNPTLDAILEEMQLRYQGDATFYRSRPDAEQDPLAFADYARRLSHLTGPGLLNDVIDRRLPWLRQLREICVLMVAPVKDAHTVVNLRWFNDMLAAHLPLDRAAQVGSAHSWREV